MNHYSNFLPGEGGYLLDLLQDVSKLLLQQNFYDFIRSTALHFYWLRLLASFRESFSFQL